MMSHPDPATHLVRQGWTVSDDRSLWSHKRERYRLDIGLMDGALLLYGPHHIFSLEAPDVYALSLLAEQTRLPAAPTSPRDVLIARGWTLHNETIGGSVGRSMLWTIERNNDDGAETQVSICEGAFRCNDKLCVVELDAFTQLAKECGTP